MVFIVLLLIAGRSSGCNCYPRSIGDEVQDANLVAHGRVIREQRKADHYEFTVVLKRAYKSSVKTDTILVRTHINPELNCDAVLELNKEYILYLWMVDETKKFPEFRTRTCSRTRSFEVNEEKEILKITG